MTRLERIAAKVLAMKQPKNIAIYEHPPGEAPSRSALTWADIRALVRAAVAEAKP